MSSAYSYFTATAAPNQQQLSSAAAISVASQKLLSQFIFLQNGEVLPTKVLIDKLFRHKEKIQSESLKDFIAKSFVREDESQLDIEREIFNGIVLDLIDQITDQFNSISLNNNNSVIGNSDSAVADLNLLYNTIFSDEALLAGWWNATEKSRWRGSSTAAALSSESNSSNGVKLMFGVTMAVEL